MEIGGKGRRVYGLDTCNNGFFGVPPIVPAAHSARRQISEFHLRTETCFDSGEIGGGARTADSRTEEPGKPVSPALERVAYIVALLLATSVFLWLEASRLREVWLSGSFFDTDDAMRMVQVRDLLAGQSWYDMTQWRLDPPGGVFMHWSRIVDLALIPLLKFFRAFSGAGPGRARGANRLSRRSSSLGSVRAAPGRRGFSPAASARVYGRFRHPAVRRDHLAVPARPHRSPRAADHAAVLRRRGAGARLRSRASPWAALTGACMAVSLGIGLENLPFFLVVAATPGLAFAWRGAEARAMLVSFAAGLALTLVAGVPADGRAEPWLVPACDALSAPIFVGALAGAAAYGLLSLCGRWPAPGRFAALALSRRRSAPLALFWPACLQIALCRRRPGGDELWLIHVSENLTLRQDFAVSPDAAAADGGSRADRPARRPVRRRCDARRWRGRAGCFSPRSSLWALPSPARACGCFPRPCRWRRWACSRPSRPARSSLRSRGQLPRRDPGSRRPLRCSSFCRGGRGAAGFRVGSGG